MGRRRSGLIIVGLVLLAVGGYSLYNLNANHAFQSTFNVLPLKFFKLAANLRDQTRISGSFREMSGNVVNFLIMSSVQFASFQTGQNIGDLYAISDAATGTVDFTSTAPDTYYLLFTHGTGLSNTTQTVSFQRTYTSLDEFAIATGALLVVLGIVEVAWGLRSGGDARTQTPEWDQPGQPPLRE